MPWASHMGFFPPHFLLCKTGCTGSTARGEDLLPPKRGARYPLRGVEAPHYLSAQRGYVGTREVVLVRAYLVPGITQCHSDVIPTYLGSRSQLKNLGKKKFSGTGRDDHPHFKYFTHWKTEALRWGRTHPGADRKPQAANSRPLVHRHTRHGVSTVTDTSLHGGVSRGSQSPRSHLDLADRFLVLLVSCLEEGFCLMDQVAQILLLLGTQSKGGQVRRVAWAAGAQQGQGIAGRPVRGQAPGSPRPAGRWSGCSW